MPVLSFDKESHAYALDGIHIPGVTSVLQPYTGLEFVNWEVLQAAADFGRNVHLACHLFNLEELDFATLDPALRPYVDAWAMFLETTGAVVIKSEDPVYSVRHKYAGTPDVILDWNDREVLTDLKSTASVPRTVGPQCAAYVQAYNEMHHKRIRHRYCLHLKPNGKFASHKLDNPRDWTIFQSCLNVHRWFYSK